MASEIHEDRYSRGLEMLRRIGGENFDGPINALAETSADLSRFTVEYPYGDVLSRPGLDLPLRQLCTVSMLLADGSAQPQLKFHIAGFLNAGGAPEAIVEFVPKGDPMVDFLLSSREDVFPDYTLAGFRAAVEPTWETVSEAPLEGSSRVLFHLRRRSSA